MVCEPRFASPYFDYGEPNDMRRSYSFKTKEEAFDLQSMRVAMGGVAFAEYHHPVLGWQPWYESYTTFEVDTPAGTWVRTE